MARKTYITDTMAAAINFAAGNGGKLHRYPGGFWAGPVFDFTGARFGTSTIKALVTRGHASYTNWKDGRHGKFPIEITVNVQQVPIFEPCIVCGSDGHDRGKGESVCSQCAGPLYT